MKRSQYRLIKNAKIAFLTIILMASLVLFLKLFIPKIMPALEKTAIFSTTLTMPEGVVAQILKEPQPSQENLQEEIITPSQPEPPIEELESPTISSILPQMPEEETNTEIPDITTQILPEIPKANQGSVKVEDMSGSNISALNMNGFYVKNDTSLSKEDIEKVLETPFTFELADTTEPQVLIYHTHATESYNPYEGDIYDKRYNWRSTDSTNNMVAVGAVMVESLRENGISVVHDTQLHDYPSYDGSYANSYKSVKEYLAAYPSIKIVIDIHRDAIERDNALIVKPTAQFNGEDLAQIMIIANCDNGSGLLPNWRENFRFAAALATQLELEAPAITRPVLFSYRKYNQQLSNGAVLMEFGSHANSLEEAIASAKIAGVALAKILNN